MAAHGVKTANATSEVSLDWLWTWNGKCFGYRRGDSLFTYDGIEVGRFSGAEIYDADGWYLGEVRRTVDEQRLITNSYKKSIRIPGFEAKSERGFKRPGDRAEETLYCGHEAFPEPAKARKREIVDPPIVPVFPFSKR